MGNNSLGSIIKTLGDWVQTSAGSKWNTSIAISGVESISIGITLAIVVSSTIRISSISSMVTKMGNNSLGGIIKTLGDWVQTSAGSKWNTSIAISGVDSISIGFTLAASINTTSTISWVSITIVCRQSSLGHRVKTLGDKVKTSAGSKGNSTIAIYSIQSISISIS